MFEDGVQWCDHKCLIISFCRKKICVSELADFHEAHTPTLVDVRVVMGREMHDNLLPFCVSTVQV